MWQLILASRHRLIHQEEEEHAKRGPMVMGDPLDLAHGKKKKKMKKISAESGNISVMLKCLCLLLAA